VTEAHVHRYRTAVRWSGSTGVGYEHYDRNHTLTTEPATATLDLSSVAVAGSVVRVWLRS